MGSRNISIKYETKNKNKRDMEIINVNEKEKIVKIERSFFGMDIQTESKKLIIFYRESIIVDGEIIKTERKAYERDFDFWLASELGQEIVGMVNLDLKQEDPSAPRA